MKVIMFITIIIIITIIVPRSAFARVTPEDIVNSKREAYSESVKSYSLLNKQKLEKLSGKITAVNKKRTDELDRIMVVQAAILDEYQNRIEGKNTAQIEKARYWITYAHEAVAYQAAKIYIFNLTSEGNMKNDALNLISLMQGELNSARSKVINSQKILLETIKLK